MLEQASADFLYLLGVSKSLKQGVYEFNINFTLFTFSFTILQTPDKCKRESEPKEKNLRLLQHSTIKKQMSEEKQSTKPEKLSPEVQAKQSIQ